MPEKVVGQAVYTWSSETLDPRERKGYGFVAASPTLVKRLPWLRHITSAATQFAGSEIISSAQRQSYQPLGRLVDGSEALLFRKIDAGVDLHKRSGRYLVHFIVGPRERLTISALFSMQDARWLSAEAVPVDQKIELLDIPILGLGLARVIPNIDADVESKAIEGARQLVSTGSLDIANYKTVEVLAMMFCLPTWMDANAILTPEWTDSGSTAILTVSEDAPRIKSPDHRVPFESAALKAVQAELSATTRVGPMGHANQPVVTPKRRSRGAKGLSRRPDRRDRGRAARRGSKDSTHSPISVGRRGAQQPLHTVVDRWVSHGSHRLSIAEKEMIERSPVHALEAVASSRKGLPFYVTRPRDDELAVAVLRACGDVQYWSLVLEALPTPEKVVSSLTEAAPVPSVLLAAFYLNTVGDREIDVSPH